MICKILVYKTPQKAEIDIEADSYEEASRLVLEKAKKGELEFKEIGDRYLTVWVE